MIIISRGNPDGTEKYQDDDTTCYTDAFSYQQ